MSISYEDNEGREYAIEKALQLTTSKSILGTTSIIPKSAKLKK